LLYAYLALLLEKLRALDVLVKKKPDLFIQIYKTVKSNVIPTFLVMSGKKKQEKDIAPSINPEERPDLQDYRSTDKDSGNTNTCQDCGKAISNKEELAVHYNKIHAESY
jgi:hypothetical protein